MRKYSPSYTTASAERFQLGGTFSCGGGGHHFAAMNPITSWYVKLVDAEGVIKDSMEIFTKYTSLYNKVVMLKAQERAEALKIVKLASNDDYEEVARVKLKV